jgi:hypothetical protein
MIEEATREMGDAMSLWSHDISSDGRYRYRLRWCNDILPAPALVWIMLNPSTATAEKMDPTIRRVFKISRFAGYHAIEVLNLFALRSTNPHKLMTDGDPVGPRNDDVIVETLNRERNQGMTHVVFAWGARAAHPSVFARIRELRRTMRSYGPHLGVTAYALGMTSDGHPWHPLQRRAPFTGLHPCWLGGDLRVWSEPPC